ncbi:tail fiber assembly protein, partial [Xenorhabdus sp. XENO-10]
MYVYSAKNNMFYPEILKPDYVREGKWPDAGISVSEAVYLEFAANRPPVGKRRVTGSNGLPAWDDIPPPTQEELQHRAEREKQYRMSLATKAIAPLQDAADLDMA